MAPVSEQPLPCDEDLHVALATSGAVLAAGLSDGELAGVEETFGFSFPADYRRLPTLTLPLGDRWSDWRAGDEADLGNRRGWVRVGRGPGLAGGGILFCPPSRRYCSSSTLAAKAGKSR